MPTRSSTKADPAPTLRVGTSGYSYKEWKGSFYPEDLPAKDMLRFYATKLAAVELNNTFYRMPKASVALGWAAQVPEDFRFSIKASRRITHMGRLKDVADETGHLVKTTAVLGARLGVLLFQLPPNLKRDDGRLAAFLELLPEDLPTAFEFRHPSWEDDAVLAALRARGAAWVVSDVDDAPEPPLLTTAPRAYLRLRRTAYREGALTDWATRLRHSGVEEAFVFFKHEDEGAGPALARAFLAAAGALEGRTAPRRASGPRKDTRERA